MATKFVSFNTVANQNVNVAAVGADIMLLGYGGSGVGVYPQTAAGITAGWASGSPIFSSASVEQSVAAPYNIHIVVVAGGDVRRFRVDRAAGTFNIALLWYSDPASAGYASDGPTVYDTDGTTVLFNSDTGTRTTDGDATGSYFWTDRSKNAGAGDPGISITTTGAYFWVEITNTTAFGCKFSTLRFDDGVGGGGASICALRRRRAA